MLLVANLGFSQEKIPFIDYNDVIKKISIEKGNDKILTIINTLNKNDSAYFSLLVSKSYYLLQLKKFEEALDVINEGLK